MQTKTKATTAAAAATTIKNTKTTRTTTSAPGTTTTKTKVVKYYYLTFGLTGESLPADPILDYLTCGSVLPGNHLSHLHDSADNPSSDLLTHYCHLVL